MGEREHSGQIGQPGEMLGHYRLVEILGEGGMGVVWKALDSRLHREVAVKLLPEAVASDADRLARFRREARVLAALNHTNIGAIYGIEEVDGQLGLILELAPGDTLDQCLAGGPLPVEDALRIGHQVALALEAAHAQGIVHRDLKPQNVKIGPDGKVKVLDFGLAKALQAEGSTPDMSKSPTLTRQMTQAGLILGTASYMSPEQARGKSVDKRSDIWSFGCLLYESLTGRQAFSGETVTDTLTSILYREPDWSALGRDTPVPVQRLFRRCFQKDAGRRLHDIADARIEIEEALTAVHSGVSSEFLLSGEQLPARRVRWRSALLPLGALVLGAVVGSAVWSLLPGSGASARGDRGKDSGVVRFTLGHRGQVSSFPVISPDGSTVAYVSRDEFGTGPQGAERLFTRRLDSYEDQAVPGSAGLVAYTFSPDSRWLAFIAPFTPDSGRLRLVKAPVDGSAPPLAITDWPEQAAPAVVWLPGGEIVAAIPDPPSLLRIPVDDHAARATVDIQGGDFKGDLILISTLPDGRNILAAAGSYIEDRFQWSVAVLNADTGQLKVVVQDGTIASWSATGHLLFTRRDTLLAVPFDPQKLETTGGPVAITAGLLTVDALVGGWFDLSENGTLVFQPGGVQGSNRRLLVSHADGRILPWSEERRPFTGAAALSRDGQRLAVTLAGPEGRQEIWVADTTQRSLRRLVARSDWDCRAPVWSGDGSRLFYFCVGKGDDGGVFVRDVDAGLDPQLLMKRQRNGVLLHPTSIAPDDSTLLVERIASGREILALPLSRSGASEARTLVAGLAAEARPCFSADGRYLAYASDESGRTEVYVRSFSADGRLGRPVAVSNTGGSRPVWSRNGPGEERTLFYESAAGRLMAVAIGAGQRPDVGSPRQMLDLADLRADRAGAAALPGGRFVLVQRGAEEDGGTINLALNYSEEIRRHF